MRIDRLRLLLIFPLVLLVLLGLTTVKAYAQPGCPNAKAQRVQYTVKIDSTPPGATIYIDGKNCPSIGQTPWTGKLNPGTLTIILEANGYIAETKTFAVKKVRTAQELFVPLKAQPRIEVRADADRNLVGASVWIDGIQQGVISGPVVVNTTAARHQVEIKKEGFETFTTWVDTAATPAVILTPALKEIPKFGTIVVESDVPDAEVYIDGNKHPDNTTTTIEKVREGVHVIEVKKNGQSWTKTITVEANKALKVRAELNAGVGVVRVMSDTPDAHAFIDGIDKGPVPVDIKDIKAGEHIIQIKAKGFKTYEEKVNITPGSSRSIKSELTADIPANVGGLKIITIQRDAEVFIDGVPVTAEERAAGEVKRPAGEYLVQVRKSGTKEFQQKVKIEAGKTATVTADLKAVGKLRILTNPVGATVQINGFVVGKTPLETEVETGEKTILRIELVGYNAYEETLEIKGGDKTETISRELAVAAKSDTELEMEKRGLSSYGARTLPRGRSTVDLSGGYPYFGDVRINVGAGRIAKRFGFDATVAVRSNISRSELGLGGRAMLSNAEPFSAGVFTNFWWGTRLFDASFRNGFTWEAGGVVSLTALSNVTISGRGYFQFWSDRHCPGLDASGNFEVDSEPINTCKAYKALVIDGMPEADVEQMFGFTQTDRRRAEKLTGNDGRGFFDRDNGARFLLSVVAEIAFDQFWSGFVLLEGAPFQGQDERALFTDLFSGSMEEKDFLFYGRAGLTYKF